MTMMVARDHGGGPGRCLVPRQADIVVPRFGEKEAYMGFMNEFLEHNWSTMTEFLQSVASPESNVHMATYDGYVDLALELATLHLLLCDIFSSLDQVPPPICPAGQLAGLATSFSPHRELVSTAPRPPIVPITSLSCPGRPHRRSWSPYPPSSLPSGRGPPSPSLSVSAPPQREVTGGWTEGHMGPRWTCGARKSFGRGMTLGWVWGGSRPGRVQGIVLVLVGSRVTLVQNGFKVTGPSWVQGMVLVPDGSSRWLRSS